MSTRFIVLLAYHFIVWLDSSLAKMAANLCAAHKKTDIIYCAYVVAIWFAQIPLWYTAMCHFIIST